MQIPVSSTADGGSEGVGAPLNELRSRLQGFCVGQVERHLLGDRVNLMERAIARLDMCDLIHVARLVTATSGDPARWRSTSRRS